MALIGIKKLDVETLLALFDADEYSLSKGVYTSPRFERNTKTGEVRKLSDKVTIDYFIHKKGDCTINRKPITKAAASAVMAMFGKTVSHIPEIPNY